MLNVPAEAIGELDRGDFIAHLSGSPPLPFHIHKHLLGFEHRMSDSEWQAVKADQLRRYYRPIEAPVPAQAVPPHYASSAQRPPLRLGSAAIGLRAIAARRASRSRKTRTSFRCARRSPWRPHATSDPDT